MPAVCAALMVFVPGLAAAQYRVVTPDGKVLYTDQPPASPKARVTELQPPAAPPPPSPPVPASGTAAVRHANPGASGVPVMPSGAMAPVPPERMTPAAVQARREHAECMRANASAIEVANASREVVRARDLVKAARAQGRDVAYAQGELDRAWQHYLTRGGKATGPDGVRVPEDPCSGQAERAREQLEASRDRYQSCAASHQRELRLARLSGEVVQARHGLALAEKLQQERLRDPQAFEAKTRGSGEWRALAKMEPAMMREIMAQRFAEYRSAGGTAARADEVTVLPDPCLPERGALPPSPVRREAVLIPSGR
jgi:hypothetical protein